MTAKLQVEHAAILTAQRDDTLNPAVLDLLRRVVVHAHPVQQHLAVQRLLEQADDDLLVVQREADADLRVAAELLVAGDVVVILPVDWVDVVLPDVLRHGAILLQLPDPIVECADGAVALEAGGLGHHFSGQIPPLLPEGKQPLSMFIGRNLWRARRRRGAHR